jgi:hypothetical protein
MPLLYPSPLGHCLETLSGILDDRNSILLQFWYCYFDRFDSGPVLQRLRAAIPTKATLLMSYSTEISMFSAQVTDCKWQFE